MSQGPGECLPWLSSTSLSGSVSHKPSQKMTAVVLFVSNLCSFLGLFCLFVIMIPFPFLSAQQILFQHHLRYRPSTEKPSPDLSALLLLLSMRHRSKCCVVRSVTWKGFMRRVPRQPSACYHCTTRGLAVLQGGAARREEAKGMQQEGGKCSGFVLHLPVVEDPCLRSICALWGNNLG